MQLETMELEREGKVARLTLKRPDLLNAVNFQGTLDLNLAVEAVRDDPEARLLVIRGEGRAFCTGIDLKELSAGQTPHAYFEQWDRALRTMETMERFVLCAMHGYALGGGLQIALASDIRIATTDCAIGLPAISESIVPGLSTFRLPRYVGWGRAKWFVLSGENVDGRTAHQMGLVDHLVEPEALDEEVEKRITQYLETCSEGARQSKVLLGMHADLSQPQFFEEYLRRQRICTTSPDHAEAREAYREGRPPRWA
jgi:enoyl-CoA hydratase/carnithine racemase